MKSVISVELTHSIANSGLVVVYELSYWQQANPIVLLAVDEQVIVYLKCLVEVFGLAIYLEVEGHGHLGPNTTQLEEFLPHL